MQRQQGVERTTITVPEISQRLGVCEDTVYDMLHSREIPHLRHGHIFIISRAAYQHWEATIGEGSQEPHTAWPTRVFNFLQSIGSGMFPMLLPDPA